MRAQLILFLLIASPALAQVEVTTGALKPTYLQGEPIVATVEVTNVGVDPIAYSGCDARVTFDVLDTARRVPPNLLGCFTGEGGGGGCGVGDAPQITTGQRTTFTYLLGGYSLSPGRYRAGSPAGRGSDGDRRSTTAGRHCRRRRRGINRANRCRAPSSIGSSRSRLSPRRRKNSSARWRPTSLTRPAQIRRRYQARSAIVESAPPFLAARIARFADDQPEATGAIDALGRMNTPESRGHLKRLYADRRFPARRSAIALALARIGNPDDLEFLAGIAHDPVAADDTRRQALLGLGHIGGDRAARELGLTLSELKPPQLWNAVVAIGNTRSREAVSILIDAPVDIYRDNVCNALITLTHRQWCGGDAGQSGSTGGTGGERTARPRRSSATMRVRRRARPSRRSTERPQG